MRSRGMHAILAAVLLMAGIQLVGLHNAFGQQPGPIARGREVFIHTWEALDGLSPDGDGLGPLFNAKSCLACHSQGGPGGGGPLQHNVDMLTVAPEDLVKVDRDSRAKFVARLKTLHPGFSETQATVVLHTFSTEPDYERWRYEALGLIPRKTLSPEQQLLALASAEQRSRRRKPVTEFKRNSVHFILSQRNTPALFGAGLIDQVPALLLTSLASEQAARFPGVSGRVAGRFGWRGQVGSLQEFVLGACANELGLQFKQHKQAQDPLDPDRANRGDDLNQAQAEELIQFVAALPAPRRIEMDDDDKAEQVSLGERFFHSVGCSACHVQDLGAAQGIYSDLLLHDMGESLADPVPAPASLSQSTSYYGPLANLFSSSSTNSLQEWRTPPLWGVASSAPYLHDGRAETLEDAITLHGGEAEFSINLYRKLDSRSRSRLIGFLETLQAPDPTEVAKIDGQAPLAIEALNRGFNGVGFFFGFGVGNPQLPDPPDQR